MILDLTLENKTILKVIILWSMKKAIDTHSLKSAGCNPKISVYRVITTTSVFNFHPSGLLPQFSVYLFLGKPNMTYLNLFTQEMNDLYLPIFEIFFTIFAFAII